MQKPITIKLDNRSLEVKKLPLRKYADLLAAFKELPKGISEFSGLTNDQIFEKLPTLVANSFPEVVNILTIATDLTKEEAEELGLDDLSRIVAAVVEVNNYREVYENLKKIFARPTITNPATTK